MPSALPVLTSRLSAAAAAAFGASYGELDPELRPATRPEFGHFQTNLPLRLAKALGRPPRVVAADLVAHLDLDDLCEPPEIAGPGFVNLTLLPSTLAAGVNDLLQHRDRFPASGRRVVVDYSQPNVAKQMHVGHLRSTVIGDSLCAVLRYVGHDVIRQNHVGDWGTQFGMLVEQLLDEQVRPGPDQSDRPDTHVLDGQVPDGQVPDGQVPDKRVADEQVADEQVGGEQAALDLAGLERLYRRARRRFDIDAGFADRARARVVALQSGDARTLATWRQMVEVSLTEFDRLYAMLGSDLTRADVVGESAYNDRLPGVVADLAAGGLLTESGGAQCVFLPGFTGRDGAPLPVIVQKSDGGFGYSATDLAAIRHRVDHLHADRLIYVVDHRQTLHFQQIFALARAAGWLPETTAAEHVAFGAVLGADGKPFKTREGGTVSLISLLDEAVSRAAALLHERDEQLDAAAGRRIAQAVGIGAVKYADLSNDRTNDYSFLLDRMVAMTGNTGPYLQYAHARLTRLLEKAGPAGTVSVLAEPAEQRLALLLGGFDQTVEQVADMLQPHRLCTYLYELATALSAFYETCPVLSSSGATRTSRIALCTATRQVLKDGLGLLGITAPDAM